MIHYFPKEKQKSEFKLVAKGVKYEATAYSYIHIKISFTIYRV